MGIFLFLFMAALLMISAATFGFAYVEFVAARYGRDFPVGMNALMAVACGGFGFWVMMAIYFFPDYLAMI